MAVRINFFMGLRVGELVALNGKIFMRETRSME